MFRALFYRDRGRPLSLLHVLFYRRRRWLACACVYVHACVRAAPCWILSAGLLPPFFSFLLEEGLHRVSRYTSGTDPSVFPRKTALSFGYYSSNILTLLHPARRSRSFVDSSFPLPSPHPARRGFNFVHTFVSETTSPYLQLDEDNPTFT